MNKNPQLMLMGDDGPSIYFDGNWLVQSVASFLIRFNGPPMAWHTYSIIVDLERPVEIVALEEVLGRPTSD